MEELHTNLMLPNLLANSWVKKSRVRIRVRGKDKFRGWVKVPAGL